MIYGINLLLDRDINGSTLDSSDCMCKRDTVRRKTILCTLELLNMDIDCLESNYNDTMYIDKDRVTEINTLLNLKYNVNEDNILDYIKDVKYNINNIKECVTDEEC